MTPRKLVAAALALLSLVPFGLSVYFWDSDWLLAFIFVTSSLACLSVATTLIP